MIYARILLIFGVLPLLALWFVARRWMGRYAGVFFWLALMTKVTSVIVFVGAFWESVAIDRVWFYAPGTVIGVRWLDIPILFAIRRPARFAVERGIAREACNARSIHRHRVDFPVTVAMRFKRDARAIARDRRRARRSVVRQRQPVAALRTGGVEIPIALALRDKDPLSRQRRGSRTHGRRNGRQYSRRRWERGGRRWGERASAAR